MKTKEQILAWLDKKPWKGEFYEAKFLFGTINSFDRNFLHTAFEWSKTTQGAVVWAERAIEYQIWYATPDEPSCKEKDLRPVTERIKTFEDACAELGDNNLVHTFKHFEHEGFAAGSEDLIAYLKLRIITAALNEGWKPQFRNRREPRYVPWYELYENDDWSVLPEDIKREHGVSFVDSAGDGVVTNVVCDGLRYILPLSNACSGSSSLCYKTRELARYSAKQFASLWLDFCYLPNTECKPY